MVLSHPFRCPTNVVSGHPFDEAVKEYLGDRRWALVTSEGWRRRGAVDRLIALCGEPVQIVSDVEANPTINNLLRQAYGLKEFDTMVALGGGSVLDTAKGLVALHGLHPHTEPLLAHLREGAALPVDMSAAAIIAIPTTAGTGSEVTPWGTIWGEEGIKFSVNDKKLRPSHAILDPELCVTMSAELTLATGLDALSHAMEAIWNRRHMPVVDAIASGAIRILRCKLEAAIDNPADVALREAIQTASVNAGLAMGTTQTALAHSISYPFTARFGVPHGIACSFTLPEVARFNLAEDPARLLPIAEGLGCTTDAIPEELETWFDQMAVGEELDRYVTPQVTDQFGDSLITRARAANNIREIDGTGAKAIARAALERFCGATDRRQAQI